MLSVNTTIDRYRKDFFIARIRNELADTITIPDERREYLNSILKEMNASGTTRSGNKSKMSDDKLNDFFDKINENSYKKKWYLLPAHHKLAKIKEYITAKHPENNELLEKLMREIKNGGLISSKQVKYNTTLCVIEGITLSKNEIY